MAHGCLVSLDNLSNADVEDLWARADVFQRTERQASDRLSGKILAALFYEPSTRTRLSFESAMLRLGGRAIGFADARTSSVSKGESIADTVRMISAYADIVVMRHPLAGSVQAAAEYASVPVVSGGDGTHLHPTQTLTDLYTLRREKGRIEGLVVALCGDLLAGRTVHSLATALTRFGARVICVAPEGLRMPAYVVDEVEQRFGGRLEYAETIEDCLPDIDALYMTRLQRERLPDDLRFVPIPKVDVRLLGAMRPDTLILHPLPRVDEIGHEVDGDPRAAYFRQAARGVLVRMALLDLFLNNEGFAQLDRPFRRVDPPDAYRRCANSGCVTQAELYLTHQPVVTDWCPDQPRCAYCEEALEQGILPLRQ